MPDETQAVPNPSPDPTEDPLDLLLAQCLERVEAGEDVDAVLDALGREHPDYAVELRESVEALRETGLLSPVSPDAADGFPEMLGDFRLEQRLGRGGMGVVFLAEQRSLGRRVALKLVRLDFLYHADAKDRFRREVNAVARLAHPNIVPIYVVGEERGIPFFAMEHVAGASLDQIIDRLAGRSPTTLTARDLRDALGDAMGVEPEGDWDWDESFYSGSWSDACLRIVHGVAEALEHAHGRGVLHRDVKPSNVMLTPDGRVLLLDFGLATLTGADRMTRTGSLLGSLPYMAPEQLESRHGEVDRRTDVYGLGVTLYELLTLRLPYLDPYSSDSTRSRILEGRPAAPRRIDPTLHSDAQAVCLVAMDRDPERRYASAGAFAGDLTNALERRAVTARPAGLPTHIKRWAQRRPGGAAAALLGMTFVTLGPTAFAVQEASAKQRVQNEWERAEGEKERAQQELRRADRNFRRALDAVELITNVATNELVEVPRASAARRTLLESARDFYSLLAEEPGNDESVKLDTALALCSLGQIETSLDRNEASETAFRRSIEILEDLRATGAPDPTLEVELGNTRSGLSLALQGLGRNAEADEQLELARQSFQAVLDGDSSVPHGASLAEARFQLALTHLRASEMYQRAGRSSDVDRELSICLPMLRELEGSGVVDHQVYLGFAINQLGLLSQSRGQVDDAIAAFTECVELFEPLLVERPTRDVREQYLVANTNLGASLHVSGRVTEALPYYERARNVSIELAEDFPNIPQIQADRAALDMNLGSAYMSLGRSADAGPLLEESVRAYRRIVDEAPQTVDFHLQLATAIRGLAHYQAEYGDADLAIRGCDEFDEIVAQWGAANAGFQGLQGSRWTCAYSRVRALSRLGLHELSLVSTEDLPSPDDPVRLFEIVRALVAGATAVESESALSEDDRALWRDAYLGRGADLALRALDAGLDPAAFGGDDMRVLREDPLLAPRLGR